MRNDFAPKAAFFLSALALAFLGGYGVRGFGWFPDQLIRDAWQQAKAVTSPPPEIVNRVYAREGVTVDPPQSVQPGLTLLVSAHWPDFGGTPGAKLIDHRGDVVHEWRVSPDSLFGAYAEERGRDGDINEAYLHGSQLLPNGDLLVNVEYWGTARLDACGRVQWRLYENGHHSIDRDDDGSFWVSGNTESTSLSTPDHPGGLPGIRRPVYQDRILHVSASGELLESINVLDLLYANDLERYIPRNFRVPRVTERPVPLDITHLNDVEPLSDSLAASYPLFDEGDLLISLKHLQLVLVMDPESRDVLWHEASTAIRQHDADFMGEGWIGVFDNNTDFTDRGSMLGGSRIVAFQPSTDSTRVLFPTEKSDPFYTRLQGKWQQLENGNLLLTESRAGRAVEVTPGGETVWEWVAPAYDSDLVPAVTEATRYPFTKRHVSTWPCSPGGS